MRKTIFSLTYTNTLLDRTPCREKDGILYSPNYLVPSRNAILHSTIVLQETGIRFLNLQ